MTISKKSRIDLTSAVLLSVMVLTLFQIHTSYFYRLAILQQIIIWNLLVKLQCTEKFHYVTACSQAYVQKFPTLVSEVLQCQTENQKGIVSASTVAL